VTLIVASRTVGGHPRRGTPASVVPRFRRVLQLWPAHRGRHRHGRSPRRYVAAAALFLAIALTLRTQVGQAGPSVPSALISIRPGGSPRRATRAPTRPRRPFNAPATAVSAPKSARWPPTSRRGTSSTPSVRRHSQVERPPGRLKSGSQRLTRRSRRCYPCGWRSRLA
jgi:hypothetical protein